MMSFYYPRPSQGRIIDLWAAPSPAPDEGGYSDVIEAEGTPLTTPEDCGFVFAGYAIPLYDPEENWIEESAECPSGWTVWTEWIGWHVATASTCTIQLHTGAMRMYVPEPRLVREAGGVANEDDFPLKHPGSSEGRRYPNINWSSEADGGTPRFSSDYISFVDSADGLRFPIYAPKMRLNRFGCDNWDDDNADWTTAGWTPTCVPSRTDLANAAQVDLGGGTVVYSIYRDPSVVYVASRNVYLMFAVECRSLTQYVGDTDTSPCDLGGLVAPYTRLVVFLSGSPDFAAATTSPNPVDASALAILLQPEVGSSALEVVEEVAASEGYGVPHATMNEAGDKVLVYVAWDPTQTSGYAPPRMKTLYGGDGNQPWTREPFPGVSVFAIDAGALVDALDAGDNAEVLALATAGYQGEALFTDNTRVGDALQTLWGIDHQFVLCGGHLWAWYGAAEGCVYGFGEVECGMGVNQIRRLQHVPIAEVPWELRELFEGTAQGDYTVFLAPSSCWIAYDLDPVLPREGDPLAASTRDPDVAVLPDGRLRVSTFYQGAGPKVGEADEGLVQVIATAHALCTREDFFTSEPEEALDCDALCSSSNLGDQALCMLRCQDASIDLDRCEALCARTDPVSRLLCELNCGGLQVSPRIDEPSPFPGVIVGNDSTHWRHEYTTTRGARIFSWP